MKSCLIVAAFALSAVGLSAQSKPIVVVNAVTAAPGLELPYDLKQMQGQLVAELRVIIGKDVEVVSDTPAESHAAIYVLDCEVKDWRPGNAAKRVLVGLGSGREASEIRYRVTDASGKPVFERDDTVRTNFYSQTAGSTGTLAHPIAQKIADRIKDAKLR